MKNALRLSLRSFSEQLETQLNSLSVDQFRNVIRRMMLDIAGYELTYRG